MDLSPILEYQMDDVEAQAYKCAMCWENICKKMFPKTRYGKLKKTGDPRKSYLFKCCWQLSHKMRGILTPDDYKYYIYANLKVIKDGYAQQKNRIDPSCLLGEKAWWRWKLWNKKFEETQKFTPAVTETKIIPHHSVVIKELERSKEYLLTVFKKTPTKEDIEAAVASRSILRWLTFGKISPYFIVVCPYISNEGWGVDLNVYKNHINKNVKVWYGENF